MLRTCKQCGKTFNLTHSEIDFYTKKGLQLPKRCESCRNANKKKNSSNITEKYQPEKNSSSRSTSIPIKMIILLIILVIYGLIQLATYTNNIDTNSSNSVEYSSTSQSVTTSQDNIIDNNTELVTTIQDTSATQEVTTTQDITTVEETTTILETTSTEDNYIRYYFRNNDRLVQHYEKHGIEMGFASAEDYEKSASDVINNPNSLHKLEAEDNDDVYYLESTGEFVILSTDGYIRTYYYADLDYFNRQ